MKYSIIGLFLSLPYFVFSQSVFGKIVDGNLPLEHIKVSNSSKNSIRYSNTKGAFEIIASLGDTITFTSLFHKNQSIQVAQKHLDEKIIIVLKEDINNLDEVIINANQKPKKLDLKKYNTKLNSLIKNDIKLHPLLYGITPEDLVIREIKKMLSKIFKKKKPKVIPISYEAYYQLFKNDVLFNDTFLKKDLKIKDDFKSLFFDYCEAQQITIKLLEPKNKFLLLDVLIKHSFEFNALIQEYI